MRFKTQPIFTLATYRMGLNFSIRVTPNINSITVGLPIKHQSICFDLKTNLEPTFHPQTFHSNLQSSESRPALSNTVLNAVLQTYMDSMVFRPHYQYCRHYFCQCFFSVIYCPEKLSDFNDFGMKLSTTLLDVVVFPKSYKVA